MTQLEEGTIIKVGISHHNHPSLNQALEADLNGRDSAAIEKHESFGIFNLYSEGLAGFYRLGAD